jgi:hypothetical protein
MVADKVVVLNSLFFSDEERVQLGGYAINQNGRMWSSD